MNERVPDSSGLPLRAMVMVLLFLGTVFLLVGLQAVGGDDSDDDSAAATTTSATTSAPATSEEPAPRAQVRVYNISQVDGVANTVAERLRGKGWDVTEVDNLPPIEQVTATTVYFGEAEGEESSARDVGKLLEAPVEPRIPELAEQAPGVIVLVTG